MDSFVRKEAPFGVVSLKISIVTPSLNQGAYLEACIQSILIQKYSNLEYVIMDGGSRDHSAAIIRKYAGYLHDYRIGPDKGHYHAINQGFLLTRGGKADIMGWLNSDDMYMPWAFSIITEIFSKFPQVEWLTTTCPVLWNTRGVPHRTLERNRFSAGSFFAGDNCHKNHIQQESTFWRRSLWERSGGALNPQYTLAADFELWARFFRHAHCYGVCTTLGGFREHPLQQTAQKMEVYLGQAREALEHHQKHLPAGYLFRHQLMSAAARTIGKRGMFRNKQWIAPDSFIAYDKADGWKIKGPAF